MEPIGLAVGIAGLAGLFSSCLEAVDMIHTYLSFGADSHVLDTRFRAAKVRLEKWGRCVGLEKAAVSEQHHPALDEHDISATVQDILKIIKTLSDASDVALSRSSQAAMPGDGSSSRPLQTRARGLRRQKLNWALRGKTERTDQILLFEQLVQQLHNLVPAHGAWSIDELNLLNISSESIGAPSTFDLPAELRRLLAQIEEANRQSETDIRREVQQWLGHWSLNETYHDSTEARLDGTCDWILQRPVFQQWLDNDFTAGPKLLWINGPAGFGKTILCAHIVKHVSSTLDTPVAHFFFSSGLESRDDAFIALRSWTAQVVSQNEAAFAHVRQKWDADPVPIVSRANVITIFKDLLHLVPGCTLIVDGLDECTYLDNHSTSVTRFIDTVIGAVVGTDARVLVVSRAEPEIRHALTTQADGAFTEYEIWHDDVQPDTATYARNIVDRKLPNKSDDIRSTLAVIMNDRCEGQFIWLKMQEKSLRKGMNKQQLEKSIKETPTGLNQLYDQTWQRITQYPEWERQRTHALLRWAAFAVRPLTVGEVTEAVLIDGFQDAIVENLPDAIDDDYIDSEIVSLCGSLLEVRGQQLETSASLQTVHLTHFSVKQYLLYNLPTPGLMEENESLWDGYHNALLAKSCLHYISFQRIWQSVTDGAPCPGMAFRNYAAASWHRHVKSGLPSDRALLPFVIQFLDRRNPTWNHWKTWFDEQYPDFQDLATASSPLDPICYAVNLRLDDVAMALMKQPTWGLGEESDFADNILLVASLCGNYDIVKMLLDRNANPSAVCKSGKTPMYLASEFAELEVTRLLLAEQADFTLADDHGWTPINVASAEGHLQVVELLVQNGVDFNTPNNENGMKMTPLYSASRYGHLEVVKLLLQKGADHAVPNIGGWTPVNAASHAGNLEVVKLLIENGADFNTPTMECQLKRTPLYSASTCGHSEVVEFLLEVGADMNVANTYGSTPLNSAALGGHLATVKCLLRKGADLTVANNEGHTPLHSAVRGGHLNVAQFLLEKAADLSIPDRTGATPLHRAAQNGHLEVVKLLLETGADFTITDNEGFSSLHLAAANGHSIVVRWLLENGADGSFESRTRWTPLTLAISHGHLEVVELLLEYEEDLKVARSGKRNPLRSVPCYDNLDRGHDIDFETPQLLKSNHNNQEETKDALGVTPLIIAARNGDTRIVEVLLTQKTCTPSHTDWYGSTALFAAARSGHANAVELLLTVDNTPMDQEDGFGRTALWWAELYGHSRVAELLRHRAKKQGIVLNHDTPTPRNMPCGTNGNVICDACLIAVPLGCDIYHCDICNGGDFDICLLCFEMGVRCLSASHTLRMLKKIPDGT